MAFPYFALFALLIVAALVARQVFGPARFLHGVFFFLALMCALLLLKRLEKVLGKRRIK